MSRQGAGQRSVAEIQRELDEAIGREAALDAMLNEAKSLFEDRCFETDIAVVRLSNFKLNHGRLQYTRHYVSCYVRPKNLGAELACSSSNFETAESTWDIARHHKREITRDEFDAAWRSVITLVQARQRSETNPVEVRTVPPAEIDIDYVELTSREQSILRASPFMLPNGRHLTSPGAKRFAAAVLAGERAEEARVSHLYEECDRGYVEGKRADWASIEKKFAL